VDFGASPSAASGLRSPTRPDTTRPSCRSGCGSTRTRGSPTSAGRAGGSGGFS